MRGRHFNKRVEFWTANSVADGFGGYNVTDTLLTSSWANINTVQANARDLAARNSTDLGLVDPSKSIAVTVRNRKDIDYNVETMYMKYRDNKYTISIAPVNTNFQDGFITFLATQETTKTNTLG